MKGRCETCRRWGHIFDGKCVLCLGRQEWDAMEHKLEEQIVERNFGTFAPFPNRLAFRVRLKRGQRFLHENEPEHTTIESLEILDDHGEWSQLWMWCLWNRDMALKARRTHEEHSLALEQRDEKIEELREEVRNLKRTLGGRDRKYNDHKHELFMEMVKASRLGESR